MSRNLADPLVDQVAEELDRALVCPVQNLLGLGLAVVQAGVPAGSLRPAR